MSDVSSRELADYACLTSDSLGRLHPEDESPTRTIYQRDRDRIIHSTAFRRLEYKTQVFVNHEGDHYRTRLTHSLEVAQLTRSICRYLRLDEDLGEALALAHDLGHTPFGHAGEDGLSEVMAEFGGFDHNAQAIRILTKLEHRYAGFDGLNLSWEVLEGIAKHNGPVISNKNNELEGVPYALAECEKERSLRLCSFAGAEAQISAIADDIAYNNHDLEDGIRAGLFSINDLSDLPLVGDVIKLVDKKYGELDNSRRVGEVIRRIISMLVEDVIAQVNENILVYNIKTTEDIRCLGKPLVHFSSEMQDYNKSLKEFLMERMYRHYKVNRMTSKARRVVKELFVFFHAEPECLPTKWYELSDGAGTKLTARVVADFIAGMTDRFAIDEHKKIYIL